MPVSLDHAGGSPVIRITGVTQPDEANELLAILKEHQGAPVDLAEMEHLHTALLQMLRAAKTVVAAWPEDDFWRKCFDNN